MKNNKGFSLIELVVVVAILAILGVAVFGFIFTGSHSYRGVSDEADLQYNAQLVINQVENMLIDSTKGVAYSCTDEAGNKKQVLSDKEISGTPNEKTLTIYSTGEVFNIIWKDKVLSLQKDNVDAGGNVISTGKMVRMADNVTFFAADITQAANSKVRLDFIFEAGDRVYKSVKNVSLRNTLVVNGDNTEMYDQEVEVSVVVDRVSISHKGLDVTNKNVGIWVERTPESLGNIHLTATVHGNVLLSEVIWTISGNSSVNTRVAGGDLVIGADETADRITVTAISKNDTSKSASTVVVLKEITGVSVRLADSSKSTFYKGDVFEVVGAVNGTNLTDEDKRLIWDSSGASFEKITNDRIRVTITASVGQKVEIGATSASNNSHHAELEPITVSHINYKIVLSATERNLRRNGSISGITADINPSVGYGTLHWVITKVVNNSTGAASNSGAVTISGNGTRATLKCTSDLDWNQSYTVYYKAYVEVDGKRFESNEEAAYIDMVYVNIWEKPTKFVVTASQSQTIKAAKGSVNYYGFEVFGINAKFSTNSNGSQYVAETEVYEYNFKVVLTSDAKNSEPKIPVLLDGKLLNYVYFNTN